MRNLPTCARLKSKLSGSFDRTFPSSTAKLHSFLQGDNHGKVFIVMTMHLQQVSEIHNLDLPPHTARGDLSQGQSFLIQHPEGIVLTDNLRAQIQMAVHFQDLTILIEGETGTGKEQIVQLIHRQLSDKNEMPLVVLNCASLHGDLAASTLFGHKKGAFTGAHENHLGAIGQAHRGILFLDEFHRLPAPAQEQLLRTLQDGSYQRVGDTTQRHSDFRLIIATPKNIEKHALAGEIMLDLRFRLYGVDISIPPLRHRLDQLEDLIDCFLGQQRYTPTIRNEEKLLLIKRCSQFYWQGNIRQLFGVLQSLCLKARVSRREVLAMDLPIHPTMLAPTDSHADVEAASSLVRKAAKSCEIDLQETRLMELIRGYT
ncbi:MAG: sigma 54-interacting transcriptional regulator, partial [Pseudobdellovibrionaceae bacterium]|nr:sigma 54-interacting transcriptional regulator [Pseudobdellovibrionaceae bacterium]